MGRESIEGILGQSIHIVVYRNKISSALSNSSIFFELDSLSLEKFIESLSIKKIHKGEFIVRKGQKCRDIIFFVLDGKLEKNENRMEIEESDEVFYGEKSLENESAKNIFNKDFKFEG